MATIEGGVSGGLVGVGVESQSALHVTQRPVPVGALGHYRASHRCAMVATQAANSRLFEFRNAHASNLCVLLHLRVQIMQTAAHTAAIETSLDCFRVTGFSAVDTTNTVTPVGSKLRTSYGNIDTAATFIRGVTVAGAAAGMTGGTLTKDTAPLFQLPIFLLAAVPTGGPTPYVEYHYSPDVGDGEAPLVMAQNEGFLLENRVLLGAAAGSSVYIDIAWAEVTAY